MSAQRKESFAQIVARLWGSSAPDWVVVLAEEADRTSATAAARRIGYTGGVLSAVFRNAYKGDVRSVAGKVKGALLGHTVECPVLGEVRRDRCLDEQKKTFTGTSALRTRLYHACRSGCVHSRLGSTKGETP